MLDKDKLWLVFHVGVEEIDATDVTNYINECRNNFKYDESVNTIFVPEYGTVKQWVQILETPCILFPPANNELEIMNSLNN